MPRVKSAKDRKGVAMRMLRTEISRGGIGCGGGEQVLARRISWSSDWGSELFGNWLYIVVKRVGFKKGVELELTVMITVKSLFSRQ